MTWGYADFIILRCQSEPKAVVHIRLHPGRHGECEVLHEGGEEEEKLHLGQVLSKTHPLTWDKTLTLVLDFLWMTVHRLVADFIEGPTIPFCPSLIISSTAQCILKEAAEKSCTDINKISTESFLTKRERQKSCSFHKLALLIQKVIWIEGVRRLPLFLVKQHRCQIGNYYNSLAIGIMVNKTHKMKYDINHVCLLLKIGLSNDLWDCVAPQLDISVGDMRHAKRSYVSNPLDLMDNSISVRQVCTVLHWRLSGLSNLSVYLSLYLFCAKDKRKQYFSNEIYSVVQQRWLLKRFVHHCTIHYTSKKLSITWK